jgi:hypothetical protein
MEVEVHPPGGAAVGVSQPLQLHQTSQLPLAHARLSFRIQLQCGHAAERSGGVLQSDVRGWCHLWFQQRVFPVLEVWDDDDLHPRWHRPQE